MLSDKKQKKILFLYSELAGYFLACLNKLIASDSAEVHLVHWPVNKEAPFQFTFNSKLRLYNKNNYDANALADLVKKIDPDLVYCSGWIDKDYVKICSSFKKRIPVVAGLDNQWKGSVKQHIASVIRSFKIKKTFTHCWVPGKKQEEYALKLGFGNENILQGFYSCDFDFFYQLGEQNKELKKKKFPKRFVYVGRYYAFKGVNDLWNSFIDLQKEKPNEWELWCLGTGDITPVKHEKIKHFGFVQPGKMPDFIADTGVFILPSHFEPWGVVVHEFAAAGFPLICSNEVGAADAFIKENENGSVFRSADKEELKQAMKKMMNSSDEQLIKMGYKSVEMASQITPAKWTATILTLLK